MDSNRNTVTDWVASAAQPVGDTLAPPSQPRARSWAVLAILMIAIVATHLVAALIVQAGRPADPTTDPSAWVVARVVA